MHGPASARNGGVWINALVLLDGTGWNGFGVDHGSDRDAARAGGPVRDFFLNGFFYWFLDFFAGSFWRQFFLRHPAALDLVECQRSIDPSPNVRIAYGLHGPEVLPRKIIVSPFGQSVLQTASDIATGGDKRYSARLFQRFQPAKHRNQCASVCGERWLNVRCLRPFACFDVLQNEFPTATICIRTLAGGGGIPVAKE